MLTKTVICSTLFFTALCGSADAKPEHTFSIGDKDFLLDGKRFQIRCGEIHAARVPREYWRHRLQMCKAMGMNTVCAYLFWNYHERTPGEFTWSGQADVAEFCRLAQEEGLWVILRPGPYACAEWDGGGLPWWLLKHEDIALRSRDERFIEAARRYLNEVGRVLGPLQITQGGPILMVQAENEYGFYGNDVGYMGLIRDALLKAGFEVPLFACNPTWKLKEGFRDDLFPVVNFGTDPKEGFRQLREVLPAGPLMCGEFYPGWFDTWGSPHHLGKESYLRDLKYMLKVGASFSIYMAHGGTTFGLWAGADRPFKPDTSSYDYDAPISEAGWTTKKFYDTRELMSRYLLPGESIPEPPERNPVMSFDAVTLEEFASLFENLPDPNLDKNPRHMEAYDQGSGCILYRTTVPAGGAASLQADAVHDFGWVFLDGRLVDVFDRRSRKYKINLPPRDAAATLDILVYAMGHINFGKEIHDRKGINSPVMLAGHGMTPAALEGWKIYNLPLNERMLDNLTFSDAGPDTKGPGFWRGEVEITNPADTFLDMRSWGKGVLWINGHCLGRFWNIGPTQTMYVPGPWLKKGANQIIVLDLVGAEQTVIQGLKEPILNELHPEKDFSRSKRQPAIPVLKSERMVHSGRFNAGGDAQTVMFTRPARGKYFCIETLNAHDDKPYAAVAELDLIDSHGHPISHGSWTIAYVDSEERAKEDGTAENAIDGQTANYWHTEWGESSPDHPHRIILDLGQTETVAGLLYVPRQGAGNVPGRIKGYNVYIGDDLIKETQ